MIENIPITPFSCTGTSDSGVLILHGFTGNPVSVAPLIAGLQQKGFHVEAPLLRGHGTHWEDLGEASWQDWLADATSALEKLATRVSKLFIFGFSMGGLLASWLAATRKEPAGLILLNHALFVQNKALYLAPLMRPFLRSVPAVGNDIKTPGADERPYPRVHLQGACQFLRLIKKVKPLLPGIALPVLIFKSREDHIVPVKNALYTYRRIHSTDKEICWLENSYHVALLDYDKDLIVKKTIDFINRLTATLPVS